MPSPSERPQTPGTADPSTYDMSASQDSARVYPGDDGHVLLEGE